MNNAKIQSNIEGSTVYNHTALASTHINLSSSSIHFYRSGHIVTCAYHLNGGGGAFTEATFADISNSSIPERYIPTEDVWEEVLDTSNYRSGATTPLGVIQITTDGTLKMELLKKNGFNFYGNITYYVD